LSSSSSTNTITSNAHGVFAGEAVAAPARTGLRNRRVIQGVAGAAAAAVPQQERGAGSGSAGCIGLETAAPDSAPPEWLKSLATLMVFVASGVMHEAIIW
jgi:hypothetical protein